MTAAEWAERRQEVEADLRRSEAAIGRRTQLADVTALKTYLGWLQDRERRAVYAEEGR